MHTGIMCGCFIKFCAADSCKPNQIGQVKLRFLFISMRNENFLSHLHRGTKGQSSLREVLQPLVEGVLNDKNLSINTNPLEVYKAWINQMESETGEARYEGITS